MRFTANGLSTVYYMLNGYILTGVARFSGAAVFIFVDLFAFVILSYTDLYCFSGLLQKQERGMKK